MPWNATSAAPRALASAVMAVDPSDREMMTARQAWLAFLGDAAATDSRAVDDLIAFHERPGVPPGTVFHDRLVYSHAGPGGRPLHLFCFAAADPSERRPGVVFVHGGGW